MSFLFGKKKTISTTENKVSALQIQQSAQGVPIPIVYGRTRVSANMLWYGDFEAVGNTTTTHAGKGGGGTDMSNTTYTYKVALILGLMEGPAPIANFTHQVWSNKDVVDSTKLGLTEFEGSYTQTAWSYMVTNHANQARAYRGIVYVAASDFDLGTNTGVPNLSYEVTALLSGTSGGTDDVNPARVLQSVLTSNKFGAGWPADQLGDLTDWQDYCEAAGFFVSPAYVEQMPASEIVNELCRVGNAAPIWSEGVLKIRTYADEAVGSYTPDLTVQYNLTTDDFLAEPGTPPIKITRKRQADAINQVQLEILDRTNQYNPYIAEAKDQSNIDIYGLRPMEPISAHAICDANIGRNVAQTILQRELYVRNDYEFTVGWRYALLEPMDIVSLTEDLLGLDQLPVRIVSIEEDENGRLAMVAEDVTIGVSTPGVYATQSTAGSTPAGAIDPGDTYDPVIIQPPLALTQTPQVWIGAQGGDEWGGCQIWVSTDGGSSYGMQGTITEPARYGELTATFSSGNDPDTSNTLQVDLTISRGDLVSASASDADSLITMSWVDGEIIGYSDATLTSPFNYDLDTYIRRGQVGSRITSHASGSTFLRMDSAVQQFDISPALFGQSIYIKLLSFNKVGGGLQALSDVGSTMYAVQAEYPTGQGFAFRADTGNTSAGDPGNGFMRWNSSVQGNASQLFLDNLTSDGANMVAYYASLGNTARVTLRDYFDTNKWAAYDITGANAAAGYQTFNVTCTSNGVSIPQGDTVLINFAPIGVRSVGITMPSTVFTVSNAPVTTTGNLTVTLISQNANKVFAGPASGNAAQPTFRSLEVADIPALNYVTSVGLTAPAIFTVSNSPVTTTGNLALSLANQSAAKFFAGPAAGNAAAPTFRAVVASDFNASGANSATTLFGDMTWRVPPSANAPGFTSATLVGTANTASTTFADLLTANITVVNANSPVVVRFDGFFLRTVTGNGQLKLVFDSTDVAYTSFSITNNFAVGASLQCVVASVVPGTYTVKARWATAISGTVFADPAAYGTCCLTAEQKF